MAEPTLGDLVKMHDEVGSAQRLRNRMKRSENEQEEKNLNRRGSFPPLIESANSDAPREEPATLRKWKSKYGSKYLKVMNLKSGGDAAARPFKARDPRFDGRCGEYIPEVFRSNYDFVKDMRENEIDAMRNEVFKIRKKLAALKGSEEEGASEQFGELLSKQKRLKQLIKSARHRLDSEGKKVEQFKLINEVKRKEALDSAKEGRHPHFMKKSELRQLKLAAQYKQLSESGQIDKYLDRKRKKAAQKAKRSRPD